MKIQMTIGGGARIMDDDGMVVHSSATSKQLAETVAVLLEEHRRWQATLAASIAHDAKRERNNLMLRDALRGVLDWQRQWFKLPLELEQWIRLVLYGTERCGGGKIVPHRKAANLEPGANDPKIGTGSSAAVGEAAATVIGENESVTPTAVDRWEIENG